MSIATVLESEATFQVQAERAGLSAAYIGSIRAATLGTLGKLAYVFLLQEWPPVMLRSMLSWMQCDLVLHRR